MKAWERRRKIREYLADHGFAKAGDEDSILASERYPVISGVKGRGWLNEGDILDWALDVPNFAHRSPKSIERAVAAAWNDLPDKPNDCDMDLLYAAIEGSLVSRCVICVAELEPGFCIFDSVLCEGCDHQLKTSRMAIIEPLLPKVPIPDKLDPLDGADIITAKDLSVKSGIPVGTLKRAAWQHGLSTWRMTRDEVSELFGCWRCNRKTKAKVEAFRLKIIRYEVERMSRMVRKIGGLISERNKECTTTQPTSERGSANC